MNHTRHGLLAIGTFASATQLSLKALRLYDQLGLLKPGYIDPDSGYRYYRADQCEAARLIRMLRQMDMPLASIRQVLAAAPAEAELLVQAYLRALEAQVLAARRTVQEVLAYLRKEEPPMAFEVTVRAFAPQPIVSLIKPVKVAELDQHIHATIAALLGVVESQGGSVAGSIFGVYHGPINHEDSGPIEICVPTTAMLAAADGTAARELPGAQAAVVALHGAECDFPLVLQGYDAAYDWIRRNGYEISDSPREIWHCPPGEAMWMEVAWPFRASGAA